MASTTRAPPLAVTRLPRLTPSTVPRPTRVPIQPPTKAPAIPSRIVTRQPARCRPGMIQRASAPASNPRTNQLSKPMGVLLLVCRGGMGPGLGLRGRGAAPLSKQGRRHADAQHVAPQQVQGQGRGQVLEVLPGQGQQKAVAAQGVGVAPGNPDGAGGLVRAAAGGARNAPDTDDLIGATAFQGTPGQN